MIPRVIIKNSKIHGKGVFANKNFKKRDIVLKWDLSHTMTKVQVDKLSVKDKDYVSYVKKKYTVMQPPERFVNHSCSPNTNSKNFSDVAIREIKKGEEITSDYSKDIVPGISMKCNCGSKNCKKIIRR